MIEIKYIVGTERHSSNWGQYYVQGLEPFTQSHPHKQDSHHEYLRCDGCNLPKNQVFTIWEKAGNKHGTTGWLFSICVTDPDNSEEDKAAYGDGYCEGNFRILYRATTKTKFERITKWWGEAPEHTSEFAQHCIAHIEKRGVKVLPPLNTSDKQLQIVTEATYAALAVLRQHRIDLHWEKAEEAITNTIQSLL